MKSFINKNTGEILTLQQLSVELNASIPDSVTSVGDWEEYTFSESPKPKSLLKEEDKLAAITRERGWREEELFFADVQINIREDDGLDAKVWREYRKQLRDWPTHKNFPKEKYRPKRPE